MGTSSKLIGRVEEEPVWMSFTMTLTHLKCLYSHSNNQTRKYVQLYSLKKALTFRQKKNTVWLIINLHLIWHIIVTVLFRIPCSKSFLNQSDWNGSWCLRCSVLEWSLLLITPGVLHFPPHGPDTILSLSLERGTWKRASGTLVFLLLCPLLYSFLLYSHLSLLCPLLSFHLLSLLLSFPKLSFPLPHKQ